MDAERDRDEGPVEEKPPVRPQWRKPNLSILDVETGTIQTSGPVADGNGSTS
jgi:hypothetical protein